MAILFDTNILLYRFDARFAKKQAIATKVLRDGLSAGNAFLMHQSIIEFVAATTRPLSGAKPIFAMPEALREAEEWINQFPVLYPDEILLRTALRGAVAYQLSWFDAHIWAYAERYGIAELYSEDFQHERYYGSVRAVNPFIT